MRAKKQIIFLKIEKLMMKLWVLLLVLFPISNVFGKAMISKSNIEVERLYKQVRVEENKNESLTMKVNELQSFTNIQAVAKEAGLAYNSHSIIVLDN